MTKGHHFYIRRKKEFNLDIENPEIAHRIINAQSSIDMNKSEIDFVKSRKIVRRLERYPVIKRLE